MQYEVVQCMEDLPKFPVNEPTFADIETDGLYINCRLIQVYQPAYEKVYIIDTDIIDLDKAKEWLKPLWTVWHGAAYDFGTLNMTTAEFDDTLYLVRSCYPEWQDFKLDNVVAKLGFKHLYDGLDKKQMQKSGFKKGALLSEDQLRYSATDVIALSLIWENKKIKYGRNRLSYKIDIISLRYSIVYQQNGLHVSQKDVRRELDALVDSINENEQLLGGLNPNSPKQVKEKLGIEKSDKPTLVKLIAEGNHLAELVYNQRRLLKRRTFLNSYNYPSVITRFNPAGAATGRFTSTGGDLPHGINAQQITRNLQYLFNQNTEDTTVVHADYSTAELRAGCSIMQDDAMYQELKAGIDLHKAAASLATGKPMEEITKDDRQKGKAVSFGKIFGQSWKSFIEFAYVNYGVVFTEEESQEIHKKYNEKYKGISAYHKARWNDYKEIPVKTPTDRRNQARLGTDAINFATQGCIADTTKLAVHYLVKEHSEALNYIFNVVHDAIYLRVPTDEAQLWADRLVKAMKQGWKEMCKTPMLYYKDIPMPVEYEYINSQGEHVCQEI